MHTLLIIQTSLFLHNYRHCRASALAFEHFRHGARRTFFLSAPSPCALKFAVENPSVETHFANSKAEYSRLLSEITDEDLVVYITGHSSKQGIKLSNREHLTPARLRAVLPPQRIALLLIDSCYAEQFAGNSYNAVFSSRKNEESASYGSDSNGFASNTLFAQQLFVGRYVEGVRYGDWRHFLRI